MGEVLNNHESITGDFSDAKKVKWLNDLSKSDCFSDPRSLVLWQHYLIAFQITDVAFLNYDLTLLKVPSQPSGACQLCPRHSKLPAQAGQEAQTTPGLCLLLEGPGRGPRFCASPKSPKMDIPQPCHSTEWGSEIHPIWWEMLPQIPLISLPLSCSFSISLVGFFPSLPKLSLSFRVK